MTPYMVGAVHYYSADIGDGLVLFDAGPPTAEARELLPHQIDLTQLRAIFITHCHVDHYGLADWLQHSSGAELYLSRQDAVKFQRHEERMTRLAEILSSYGFSGAAIEQMQRSFQNNGLFPTPPQQYRIVEESPELADLGIGWVACPGHSQSDLVYLVGNGAVTGDLLLQDIFQAPLLDVDYDTFQGRFRNYDTYCSSLEQLARLRGRSIHPGHRESVAGGDQSICFYVITLIKRAVKLRQMRSIPLPELTEQLFGGRSVDPLLHYLKASEVVFMWDFLDNPQLLQDALQRIGLYDRLAELFEEPLKEL